MMLLIVSNWYLHMLNKMPSKLDLIILIFFIDVIENANYMLIKVVDCIFWALIYLTSIKLL